MEIINKTPFLVERFAIFDKNGGEQLVVVMKATYALSQKVPPAVAEVQDPFSPADIYQGEPGETGLLREGEFIPPKPSTGILLTGHAVAPQGRARSMQVAVKVGDVLQHAMIYGPRVWLTALGNIKASSPELFSRLPLTWDNAFGGMDQSPPERKDWQCQPDNPVGKGFFARNTKKDISGQPLPCIESLRFPINSPADRPAPVGFCPVAPSWQPRLAHAGTIDEKYLQEQAPLLPVDFDPRFYQTAPPGLIAPGYLRGGEHCAVAGTTVEGKIEFLLPVVRPRLRIHYAAHASEVETRLDTVHIDTDGMRLHLYWRAMEPCHGLLEAIRGVETSLEGGANV
ncbi:MAG: DUF2169 domain-containing protein [Deltaproteobacteria bacterium]|nr:DUF2169 domain-containing protein [Deltaproteobacteria bacterium]